MALLADLTHGMCWYAYLKISTTNIIIGKTKTWTGDPDPVPGHPDPLIRGPRIPLEIYLLYYTYAFPIRKILFVPDI